MNPPTALRRLPAGADHGIRRAPAGPIAAAVLLAAVLFVVVQVVAVPGVVDRVSVANPTGFRIDVEVTDRAHDGWTAVGTVDPHETIAAEEVFDVGDEWIFRFTGQGVVGSEVRYTRDEMERNGWRIAVPDSMGDTLRAADPSSTP